MQESAAIILCPLHVPLTNLDGAWYSFKSLHPFPFPNLSGQHSGGFFSLRSTFFPSCIIFKTRKKRTIELTQTIQQLPYNVSVPPFLEHSHTLQNALIERVRFGFSVIIFWSHNRARKNLGRLQEDKNV